MVLLKDGTETGGLGFGRLLLEEAVEDLDMSVCVLRCAGSHYKAISRIPISHAEPKDCTHADLLPLAVVTSLHNAHQMRMFPLLLRLRPPSRRRRNIHAVLGHDGEAWKSRLRRLPRILLRLLDHSAWRTRVSRRRSQADGSVARVGEGH